MNMNVTTALFYSAIALIPYKFSTTKRPPCKRYDDKRCIYYRDVLRQKLLPAIGRVSGKNVIFQQDSAPLHLHIALVKLCSFCVEKQRTSFLPADLWPPNCPDLNPVDYEIWAVMHRCVYMTKINTIDELKHASAAD